MADKDEPPRPVPVAQCPTTRAELVRTGAEKQAAYAARRKQMHGAALARDAERQAKAPKGD